MCTSKETSNVECDAIATTVDIFYQSATDPTQAEEQDMFDLLIATVESLSAQGAFQEIGMVQSVASGSAASTVIDDTQGNGNDGDDGDDNTNKDRDQKEPSRER